MRVHGPLGGGLLALCAGLATLPLRSVGPEIGDPLPRLSQAQLQRFHDGKAAFEEAEGPADGLGPVFNDVSCLSCHKAPATGGTSDRVVTRFGRRNHNGAFDPLEEFGGSLIQEKGIGPQGSCDYVGEVVPNDATIVTRRRTTPLFGLGLVDAVPDDAFREIARVQAALTPATAGRVHMVANLVTGRPSVGKFGWKSQVPSLLQFAGDAYLNEMGITTPLFPHENCPNGDCNLLVCNPRPDLNDDGEDMEKFADFMSMLAPPPPGPATRDAQHGRAIFTNLGCSSCHLPSLATGPSRDRAYDRVTFAPYSDFLLHDMGSLGDGIAQGDAKGSEFRTAPLWGLRDQRALLHDGRARSIPEAVLAHDGQARRSRDRFAALSPQDRDALIAFLRSL